MLKNSELILDEFPKNLSGSFILEKGGKPKKIEWLRNF